jgi:hypothetical protein
MESLKEDTEWIQTYCGLRFDPMHPQWDYVNIMDIAHALSNQCRFSGHTNWFYSVAQHSVLVSEHCAPEEALYGLLHDAAEAYLVDLPRPIKQALRARGIRVFDQMEFRIREAIFRRFGLENRIPESVKLADELLLATEAQDLMFPLVKGWQHTPENGYPVLKERVVPLPPEKAKLLFLERYGAIKEVIYGKA